MRYICRGKRYNVCRAEICHVPVALKCAKISVVVKYAMYLSCWNMKDIRTSEICTISVVVIKRKHCDLRNGRMWREVVLTKWHICYDKKLEEGE